VLAVFAKPLAGQTPDQIKPTGYVLDYAGVLSPATRDDLTSLCTSIDKLAQAQIAVVTVKTLGGRPIEEYSIDLATRLGVGPKASDRGVMILLAVDDRQYRIEVGYGLEGILPDGKVGGIGREAVPYLRDKKYDQAVTIMTRGIAEVIAADRGVSLPSPSVPLPSSQGEPSNHGWFSGKIWLLLFLLFLVLPFIASLVRSSGPSGRRGRFTRGGFGGWGGPFIGGMGGWGGGMGGGFGGSAGGGGFGGFGGGSFGGGGASGSW